MPFIPASVGDWNRWANHVEEQPDRRIRLQVALARTSAGNGHLHEQLIRLMIWVGTEIMHPPEHPGVLTPYQILEQRRGWCDQQCLLFAFLIRHLLDVDCRLLELCHSDGTSGHTVAEVLLDPPILFDVEKEHQSVYRNATGDRLLGYGDLLQDSSPVARDGHWWKGTNGVGKEGFYLLGQSQMTCSVPTDKSLSWPWKDKP